MSAVHGTIRLEVDVERLAEIVALRVAAMLAPAGGETTYRREPEPDPGGPPRPRGGPPGDNLAEGGVFS